MTYVGHVLVHFLFVNSFGFLEIHVCVIVNHRGGGWADVQKVAVVTCLAPEWQMVKFVFAINGDLFGLQQHYQW